MEHLNKTIKCRQCNSNMHSAVFNIGRRIYIKGRHCECCGLNIVDEKILEKALKLLDCYEKEHCQIIRS